MLNDPIIEEIRQNRAKIAVQFNYDVRALGRYYQERENKQVVSRPPRLIKDLPPIRSRFHASA